MTKARLANEAKYKRSVVAQRKAQGVCPVCEDPMDREGYACSGCMQHRRDLRRRLVRQRQALGLCPRCENPMDRDGYACSACTVVHRADERVRRKRRKAS